MMRLVLFFFLLAAIAIALASVILLLRSLTPASGRTGKSDAMPDALRAIAFVLLMILMLGVATGWLGAA